MHQVASFLTVVYSQCDRSTTQLLENLQRITCYETDWDVLVIILSVVLLSPGLPVSIYIKSTNPS